MRMELSPSAHEDTFCRDRLPAAELWPHIESVEPRWAPPARLNVAAALLDDTMSGVGPDRPALVSAAERLSYGELADRVGRIAAVLVDRFGLRPGGRVVLRGPNTPWLVSCWLAVLRAGGVVVSTTPLLRAGELAEIVAIAEPRLALCDHRYLDELETLADRLTVVPFGHDYADSDGLAALSARSPGTAAPVPTAADDVALISFTSGTSGRPKATLHFHRDVLAGAERFARGVLGAGRDDVFTGTPSIAFAFGLSGLLVFPLLIGASVLLWDKPDPVGVTEAAREYGATVMFSAPTAYRRLLVDGLVNDLGRVRCCVSAGEALPALVHAQFQAASGVRLVNTIGTTEMLQMFISTREGVGGPGSLGRPLPGYRVVLLDGAGRPVPDGETGELAVRGPTGCRYLDDDRQRSYVRAGWNHTGDLCRRGSDGTFQYVSRRDSLIVSAGYNIAPPEVEAALERHPRVAESAVDGIPDGYRGHLVRARVVLRDSAAELPPARLTAELQNHVKSLIAPYKYPRVIEYVSSLPRTANGKLRRGDPGTTASGRAATP